MDVYECTGQESPACWWLSDSDQHGGWSEWLAHPTPEGGWHFEPLAWNHRPISHMAPYSAHWPELLDMLAAYGHQRRGVRATGEPPPAPPAVVWVARPFVFLGSGSWRGSKAVYDAGAPEPTLLINRRWWRLADFHERQYTLRHLAGDPLGPVAEAAWFTTLVFERAWWLPKPSRQKPPPAA